MAAQEMERNEPATPYKLQKARQKGQIAKSADVVSTAVFIGAILYLYWQGREAVQAEFLFDRSLLAQAGRMEVNDLVFRHLTTHLWRHYLLLTGPFFLTLVLVAILANLAQTGPLLAFEPLKADWGRLNPIAGIRRLSSPRKVFDGLRAAVKLGVLCLVVYYALKDVVRQLFSIANQAPATFVRTMIDGVGSIGLRIGIMLIIIAALDFLYSRREFAKNMRMSRHEIKEEFKQRDGDPRIRSRLRQIRREMLKRSLSLRNTRKADVVIVNPTHYAVALRYVHGEMPSPQLVAKGAGSFAALIRKTAAAHRIPVVQNVTLARALFRVMEVEQNVPPELYGQVARIIVWVLAMRQVRTQTAVVAADNPLGREAAA
jgi:flagellar biosynthesis protein FlhB